MRPIRWLRISDIHMRVSKVWSQDVVLKAMCDDIAKQRNEGATRGTFTAISSDAGVQGACDYAAYAASMLTFPSETLRVLLCAFGLWVAAARKANRQYVT
jgi:hypothetical protein